MKNHKKWLLALGLMSVYLFSWGVLEAPVVQAQIKKVWNVEMKNVKRMGGPGLQGVLSERVEKINGILLRGVVCGPNNLHKCLTQETCEDVRVGGNWWNDQCNQHSLPTIQIKRGMTDIPTQTGLHNFGSLQTGEMSGYEVFTIENEGALDLDLTGRATVAVVGTDSDEFQVDLSGTSMSIAGGTTTTFGVRFTPTGGTDPTALRTATIQIESNDIETPVYTFDITGNVVECPAGEYVGAGGTCTATQGGYYSPANDNDQTACDAGRYCEGGNTTPLGDGLCTAGYYCPEGSATAQGDGECDAGYYCPAGSTTATQNECGLNKYCEEGSPSATSCPTNSTTTTTTSTSINDCLGNAGWYGCETGTCTKADIGYYSETTSNAQTACAPGSYTSTTGQSTCSTCTANYYCEGGADRIACTAGYTSAEGSDALSDCVDEVNPTITDDYALDGTWTTTNQTIALTANDDESGVKEIRYCWGLTCTLTSGTLYTSAIAITDNTDDTLRYQAWDNYDNPSTIGDTEVKLDKTPPTCGTWTEGTPNWGTDTQGFTLASSTDTGGSDIKTAGGTCSASPIGTTCTVEIEDNAGNTTVCESPAGGEDTNPPTVTITGAPATWQNTDATATIDCSDAESGCDATSYQYKTSTTDFTCDGTVTGWATYSTALTITSPTYVCMRAQDNAGNGYSYATTTYFQVDKTVPTASMTYDSPTVTYGDTVTITATMSEALQDTPTLQIALSGDVTMSATNMTKVSPTEYEYTYVADDGVGDLTVSLSTGIDRAGNVITATPTGGATFTVDQKVISGTFTASNKTYDGNTSATVTNRSLTGVVSGDTVTLTGGTATFDTATVGTGKIVTLTGASITGTDSGNYTLSGVATTTADITKADQVTLNASATPNPVTWGTSSTVSTTGGSGTGTVTYAKTTPADPCSVNATSGVVTSTGAGKCDIQATKASDTNYNSTTADVTITLNKQTQSAVTLTADPLLIKSGETSTLTASGGDGTGAYTYAKVSGTCTLAGNTVTPTGDGTCVVSATREADEDYLISDSSSPVTITIDMIAPTVSDDYGYDGVWTNKTQTLTLTAQDAKSGIEEVLYCWGSSCVPDTVYTAPIDILTNTDDTFRYQAQDIAGNLSLMGSIQVQINTIAPEIATPPALPEEVVQGETHTPSDLSCTDDIDPTKNATITGTVDTQTLGSYNLTYTCTDSAGNDADEVYITVEVIGCSAGEYWDGSSCSEVGIGYWSPAEDSTRTACVAGTTTTTTTADEETDCIDVQEIHLRQGTTDILSGTGSYDFGTVQRNMTSSAITFQIQNLGDVELLLTGTPKITLSGTNADQFSIDEATTTSPITGGGSTTFNVTFSPTSEGVKTATVSIANNDSDEDPYTFSVTGTGEAPPPIFYLEVLGDPPVSSGVDYGDVSGGSSLTKTFMVRNAGGGTITLTGGGENYVDFSNGLTGTLTADYTGTSQNLGEGQSTTFEIEMGDTLGAGGGDTLKAEATIAYTDGTNPYTRSFMIEGITDDNPGMISSQATLAYDRKLQNLISYDFVSGSGDGHLVLIKEGDSSGVDNFTSADLPQDGVTYTGYGIFGTTGDWIGDAYVAYVGDATAITISSLTSSTYYRTIVLSYQDVSGTIYYNRNIWEGLNEDVQKTYN